MAEPAERINMLEYKVDVHEREIKELRDDHHRLSKALTGIENSLKQIKWTVIGAVLYAAATQMGALNVAKALMGL